MRVEVFDIKWETDGEDVDIPTSLTVDVPDDIGNDEDINEYISDEISNMTGWLHTGFKTSLDQA